MPTGDPVQIAAVSPDRILLPVLIVASLAVSAAGIREFLAPSGPVIKPWTEAEQAKFRHKAAMRGRASAEDKIYPLPTTAEIDRIEKVLADRPCIGTLDRWQREYYRKVDWDRGHVNPHVVYFDYSEAGRYEFKSHRIIRRLGDTSTVDDRPYLMAYGEYDLRTGAMKVTSCGPNVS